MTRRSTLCFFAAWLIAVCTLPAAGQEWTRFRGPNGSGVSGATSVPAKFSPDDYNWKAQLPGVGHSCPVVWGERIFTMSGDEADGARIVLCVDARDGKILWSRSFPAAVTRKHKLNSFASATPAVDAHRVYSCWATPEAYVVVAHDHAGKELWRTDLGTFKAGYGNAVSLVVYDDLLIVPNEQQGDSTLVALDTADGKLRWKVARDSKTTYSTPCVWNSPEGTDALIFTNWNYGITALEPRTGKQRWEIDVFDKNHIETAIGSPIVAGDLVLGVCGWLGYGYQTVAVQVDQQDGTPVPKKVYELTRSAPLCTTPLAVDGLLFLWADQGIVTCADLQTGEVHWRKRVGGTYYSSPVSAGGKLYNISTDGEVVVLAVGREFKPLARNQLDEPSHSTPAIAGGRMYLRTFSHLISIGGKPSDGGP